MSTNALQFGQPGNLGYAESIRYGEKRLRAKQTTPGFLSKCLTVVFFVPVVLIFPLARLALAIVKWVAAIICGLDLICKFFLMLYYWHTPGMHAGWTFLLHYTAWMGLWTVLYFCLEFVFKKLAGETN